MPERTVYYTWVDASARGRWIASDGCHRVEGLEGETRLELATRWEAIHGRPPSYVIDLTSVEGRRR